MRTYTFTLTLSGVDALTPEISDTLFEAGINGDENTLLYSRDGFVYIDFELESPSLSVAIGSAVDKVERSGYGVAKVEIEEAATAG